MELRREEMEFLREKSRATSQMTFDMDYNVPDVKPDLGRMIQSKGTVVAEDVRLTDGHSFIKGYLRVDVLYVAEQEGKIHSLSAKVPLEETLNLDGIVNGDKMCLKWDIEDLSVHMIHSRKLNIKAIVTFFATVDETCGIRIPVSVKEEGISVKKKEMQLLGICVHKKDTMRIREEITLASNKPNIADVLWHSVEIRGLDFRPGDHNLKAKGEMAVFVLYEGDDEKNPLQWLEYTIPFSKDVECNGCQDSMIANIDFAVLNQNLEVKPDSDGEERILAMDVVVELDMKLYQEEKKDMILDIYTPLKECILHGKTETLESLLMRNFSKCRVVDHVEVKETQGKILQICHSQGKVRIDRTKIVDNGILVDGVIYLKILYIIGNDEQPFYSMEAMLPFSHIVEASGITKESDYRLQTDLEQLSTIMVDSNKIEIKAVVSLNVLVIQKEEQFIIDRVEEQPLDIQKIRDLPGFAVYMVKPGDTLWDIAKKYYTTVDEILELNEVNEHEIKAGSPLLLVKKVGR